MANEQQLKKEQYDAMLNAEHAYFGEYSSSVSSTAIAFRRGFERAVNWMSSKGFPAIQPFTYTEGAEIRRLYLKYNSPGNNWDQDMTRAVNQVLAERGTTDVKPTAAPPHVDWRVLSVTAISAENSNVAEYVAQIEKQLEVAISAAEEWEGTWEKSTEYNRTQTALCDDLRRERDALRRQVTALEQKVGDPKSEEAMYARDHTYVSTACFHGEHEWCRRSCKFCSTPCMCECGHKRVASPPLEEARFTLEQVQNAIYDSVGRNNLTPEQITAVLAAVTYILAPNSACQRVTCFKVSEGEWTVVVDSNRDHEYTAYLLPEKVAKVYADGIRAKLEKETKA